MPDEPQIAADNLMQEVAAKSKFHLPGGQEWIMVEENKCYRILSEWKRRIADKTAWQTPFGISLALAATMTSSEFTDKTWIAKGTLKGFFLFCLVGCVLWFFWQLYRCIMSKDTEVESFISDLKEGTSPAGHQGIG